MGFFQDIKDGLKDAAQGFMTVVKGQQEVSTTDLLTEESKQKIAASPELQKQVNTAPIVFNPTEGDSVLKSRENLATDPIKFATDTAKEVPNIVAGVGNALIGAADSVTESLGYKDAISDDYRIKPFFEDTNGLFSFIGGVGQQTSQNVDNLSNRYFDASNKFFENIQAKPDAAGYGDDFFKGSASVASFINDAVVGGAFKVARGFSDRFAAIDSLERVDNDALLEDTKSIGAGLFYNSAGKYLGASTLGKKALGVGMGLIGAGAGTQTAINALDSIGGGEIFDAATQGKKIENIKQAAPGKLSDIQAEAIIGGSASEREAIFDAAGLSASEKEKAMLSVPDTNYTASNFFKGALSLFASEGDKARSDSPQQLERSVPIAAANATISGTSAEQSQALLTKVFADLGKSGEVRDIKEGSDLMIRLNENNLSLLEDYQSKIQKLDNLKAEGIGSVDVNGKTYSIDELKKQYNTFQETILKVSALEQIYAAQGQSADEAGKNAVKKVMGASDYTTAQKLFDESQKINGENMRKVIDVARGSEGFYGALSEGITRLKYGASEIAQSLSGLAGSDVYNELGMDRLVRSPDESALANSLKGAWEKLGDASIVAGSELLAKVIGNKVFGKIAGDKTLSGGLLGNSVLTKAATRAALKDVITDVGIANVLQDAWGAGIDNDKTTLASAVTSSIAELGGSVGSVINMAKSMDPSIKIPSTSSEWKQTFTEGKTIPEVVKAQISDKISLTDYKLEQAEKTYKQTKSPDVAANIQKLQADRAEFQNIIDQKTPAYQNKFNEYAGTLDRNLNSFSDYLSKATSTPIKTEKERINNFIRQQVFNYGFASDETQKSAIKQSIVAGVNYIANEPTGPTFSGLLNSMYDINVDDSKGVNVSQIESAGFTPLKINGATLPMYSLSDVSKNNTNSPIQTSWKVDEIRPVPYGDRDIYKVVDKDGNESPTIRFMKFRNSDQGKFVEKNKLFVGQDDRFTPVKFQLKPTKEAGRNTNVLVVVGTPSTKTGFVERAMKGQGISNKDVAIISSDDGIENVQTKIVEAIKDGKNIWLQFSGTLYPDMIQKWMEKYITKNNIPFDNVRYASTGSGTASSIEEAVMKNVRSRLEKANATEEQIQTEYNRVIGSYVVDGQAIAPNTSVFSDLGIKEQKSYRQYKEIATTNEYTDEEFSSENIFSEDIKYSEPMTVEQEMFDMLEAKVDSEVIGQKKMAEIAGPADIDNAEVGATHNIALISDEMAKMISSVTNKNGITIVENDNVRGSEFDKDSKVMHVPASATEADKAVFAVTANLQVEYDKSGNFRTLIDYAVAKRNKTENIKVDADKFIKNIYTGKIQSFLEKTKYTDKQTLISKIVDFVKRIFGQDLSLLDLFKWEKKYRSFDASMQDSLINRVASIAGMTSEMAYNFVDEFGFNNIIDRPVDPFDMVPKLESFIKNRSLEQDRLTMATYIAEEETGPAIKDMSIDIANIELGVPKQDVRNVLELNSMNEKKVRYKKRMKIGDPTSIANQFVRELQVAMPNNKDDFVRLPEEFLARATVVTVQKSLGKTSDVNIRSLFEQAKSLYQNIFREGIISAEDVYNGVTKKNSKAIDAIDNVAGALFSVHGLMAKEMPLDMVKSILFTFRKFDTPGLFEERGKYKGILDTDNTTGFLANPDNTIQLIKNDLSQDLSQKRLEFWKGLLVNELLFENKNRQVDLSVSFSYIMARVGVLEKIGRPIAGDINNEALYMAYRGEKAFEESILYPEYIESSSDANKALSNIFGIDANNLNDEVSQSDLIKVIQKIGIDNVDIETQTVAVPNIGLLERDGLVEMNIDGESKIIELVSIKGIQAIKNKLGVFKEGPLTYGDLSQPYVVNNLYKQDIFQNIADFKLDTQLAKVASQFGYVYRSINGKYKNARELLDYILTGKGEDALSEKISNFPFYYKEAVASGSSGLGVSIGEVRGNQLFMYALGKLAGVSQESLPYNSIMNNIDSKGFVKAARAAGYSVDKMKDIFFEYISGESKMLPEHFEAAQILESRLTNDANTFFEYALGVKGENVVFDYDATVSQEGLLEIGYEQVGEIEGANIWTKTKEGGLRNLSGKDLAVPSAGVTVVTREKLISERDSLLADNKKARSAFKFETLDNTGYKIVSKDNKLQVRRRVSDVSVSDLFIAENDIYTPGTVAETVIDQIIRDKAYSSKIDLSAESIAPEANDDIKKRIDQKLKSIDTKLRNRLLDMISGKSIQQGFVSFENTKDIDVKSIAQYIDHIGESKYIKALTNIVKAFDPSITVFAQKAGLQFSSDVLANALIASTPEKIFTNSMAILEQAGVVSVDNKLNVPKTLDNIYIGLSRKGKVLPANFTKNMRTILSAINFMGYDFLEQTINGDVSSFYSEVIQPLVSQEIEIDRNGKKIKTNLFGALYEYGEYFGMTKNQTLGRIYGAIDADTENNVGSIEREDEFTDDNGVQTKTTKTSSIDNNVGLNLLEYIYMVSKPEPNQITRFSGSKGFIAKGAIAASIENEANVSSKKDLNAWIKKELSKIKEDGNQGNDYIKLYKYIKKTFKDLGTGEKSALIIRDASNVKEYIDALYTASIDESVINKNVTLYSQFNGATVESVVVNTKDSMEEKLMETIQGRPYFGSFINDFLESVNPEELDLDTIQAGLEGYKESLTASLQNKSPLYGPIDLGTNNAGIKNLISQIEMDLNSLKELYALDKSDESAIKAESINISGREFRNDVNSKLQQSIDSFDKLVDIWTSVAALGMDYVEKEFGKSYKKFIKQYGSQPWVKSVIDELKPIKGLTVSTYMKQLIQTSNWRKDNVLNKAAGDDRSIFDDVTRLQDYEDMAPNETPEKMTKDISSLDLERVIDESDSQQTLCS